MIVSVCSILSNSHRECFISVCILEFLISDLALSEQSIASITLSSPKLLAGVLELHRPEVIITDATFLPHVLELIYDEHDYHHKIIRVGKSDSDLKPKGMREVEIYSWGEVEANGKVPQAPKNAPRMVLHFHVIIT